MPNAETVVLNAIGEMLQRRKIEVEVQYESDLHEDLMLDSLELAELSALLEDTFGNDPYTAGVVPRTVGEVVAFYR